MSRASTPNERTIFASRTTFDALAVDSGEESGEEEAPEPVPSPPSETVEQKPLKLTKTALKKAKAAKRLQKSKPSEVAAKEEAPVASTLVPDTEAENIAEPSTSPAVGITPVGGIDDTEIASTYPVITVQVDTPEPFNSTYSTIDTNEGALQPEVAGGPLYSGASSVEGSGRTTPEPISTSKSYLPQTSRNQKIAHPNNPSLSSAQHKTASETEQSRKRQNALTRTIWGLIMVGGFIGLLLMGHIYMILLVLLCQTLVYREVTALFSLKLAKPKSDETESNGKDPWSKTLNWYFFAVTNYFLYGESIIYYFKHVVFVDAQLLLFATNHRIISFTLYTIGFVGFVMSLKKGYLKQQFGLFCWVHMSLMLIVVSSHFIVNNILEGLIWFWVPASLVICNDVFAYIWGITIGRTPLIKLSPKKTVEGFVGAFWSTIVIGVIWGTYFMQFNYMICPVHDLGVSAWSSVVCKPNTVFVWKEWEMWKPLATFLSTLLGRTVTTIPYAQYQFHLLFMSCFASLVAPFGGFFASGFKRAFNIKDFGHSIPGHGGMTDRMDCQFLMGVFTYVYYSSLIREHHVTVGSILQTIVSGLTVNEQLELIMDLKRYLQGQGITVP